MVEGDRSALGRMVPQPLAQEAQVEQPAVVLQRARRAVRVLDVLKGKKEKKKKKKKAPNWPQYRIPSPNKLPIGIDNKETTAHGQ